MKTIFKAILTLLFLTVSTNAFAEQQVTINIEGMSCKL
jgi:hypothetical protein